MVFPTKKVSKFTFIEEGSGKPMILLHGLMGGLSNFSETISHFSQNGYRVLVPQMPIYDLSILNTTLKNIAKFVIEFIEQYVGEPAILVGNSMGGHIALIITTMKPSVVAGLCLTGSSGLYERSFGDSFPRKSDKEYIRKKTQEVFYDPAIATNELVDEVFGVVNDRKKGIKTVMLARSAIRHNMMKELPDITCPTCLIWGKQDGVTPPNVAVDMHQLIKNSNLFWLDECGHAAMMEKPKEFNTILHKWLLDTFGPTNEQSN